MTAERILRDVVSRSVSALSELECGRDRRNEFCTGQIYAFTEILELIQSRLPDHKSFGLDFSVEERFPPD